MMSTKTYDNFPLWIPLIAILVSIIGYIIGALILIEFMWAWQSYLIPLFIITKDSAKPLTVAMSMFVCRWSTSYTNIAAAAVIVFIPIALLFLFTQRKFIEGLTMGYNK